MLKEIGYDRTKAFDYAKEWAFSRNPAYYDFQNIGGDCTNFASQCIYAGCGVMNHTPLYGWYYINVNDRTPSWTGVVYLYNFLTGNKGPGPYGRMASADEMEIGDIVQFGTYDGMFYHSPVVVGSRGGELYVAAHTNDAFMRPLSSYSFNKIRYIHIEGARS